MFRLTLIALFVGLALAASAPARTPAQRVVSLSPTATEDLFAIGAGKQVVAVDNDSNYPANAPHTKLDAYQLVSQVGQAPLANVCDPNYTCVAKLDKRWSLGATAYGGVHERLREVARRYVAQR